MTDAMYHRGPDADGFYEDEFVSLGHRRLAIIDLSPASNQPFTDHTGRYIITFNGEIYNFREVKNEISDYPFRTSSDTEMIIAAFSKWGMDCVQKFKGMFTFAVWDKREKKLTVARDRFGVKPLYFFNNPEVFIFASEIRSILATGLVPHTLNEDGLYEYFSFQSVGTPFTLIREIYQLGAGEYMEIEGQTVSRKQYWSPFDNITRNFGDNISTVHSKIRELLLKSVERRLVSDVPVGAFLSGGIDSSAVVGLMAEVSGNAPNTYNIYFDEEEYDESKYANMVAGKFKTNHFGIHMKPDDFLNELQPALKSMDTPSGDGINTFVVSKAIRKAGMTVALSGIGGDELFAGYPIFRQYHLLRKFDAIWSKTGMLRTALSKVAGKATIQRQRIGEIMLAPSLEMKYVYPVSREILTNCQIENLSIISARETAVARNLEEVHEKLKVLPLLSQVSVAEFMGYTQQTLLKDTDQMSMASSLEVREPFFDHDLVEYVLSIPDFLKKPSFPKQLLVESLGDLLPHEIVHRKKKGFTFPWKMWMKSELKDFCYTRLHSLSERPFMKPGILNRTWEQFLKGDNSIRWVEIWQLVVLEEWLSNNEVN